MLWHMLQFDVSRVGQAERTEIEERLRGFDQIEHVAAVRIGPDAKRPDRVVLLCAFSSADDLASYMVHPTHLAFGEFFRSMDISVVAIDLETADDPKSLFPNELGG